MITLLLVAFAATVDVPPPLEPWVPWALQGHEAERCSFAHGDTARKRCAWPGKLELDLDKTGGSFRQVWSVEIAVDVQLPGDDRRWPLDVTVDGKPAAVIGAPSVRLTPGHRGKVFLGCIA
jgi:hypothetical protein